MNLIEIRTIDHELKASCNALCHDAIGTSCDCVCGGILHGAARRHVLETTYRHNFLALIEYVALRHPDCSLHFAPSQLELWPEEGQAAPP